MRFYVATSRFCTSARSSSTRLFCSPHCSMRSCMSLDFSISVISGHWFTQGVASFFQRPFMKDRLLPCSRGKTSRNLHSCTFSVCLVSDSRCTCFYIFGQNVRIGGLPKNGLEDYVLDETYPNDRFLFKESIIFISFPVNFILKEFMFSCKCNIFVLLVMAIISCCVIQRRII